MKRNIIILIAFLFIAVSCNKDNSHNESDDTIPVESLVPRKDIVLTKAQAEYAKTGGNEFALNLFRGISSDKDMVISPLSVTFALGMIDNGALDNTKDQIEKVLGYKEASIDGLNSYCSTMMSSATEIDPTATIEFANAALINSALGSLKENFKNSIEEYYSAEVSNKNFDEEDVMGYINNWCKSKTQGKISEILHEKPGSDEFGHFLNAVYFKGIWSSQFKRKDSRDEDIQDINGKKHTVNMMHQVAHFNCARLPGVGTALSLPFGNQAYHMLFILPEDGTVSDLKKAINVDVWNEITNSLHDEKVDVKIPSFEVTFSVDLKEILKNLGIVDAFNPMASQFGLMSENSAWISSVLHKAIICIDEQGSEAAAITDAVIGYAVAAGGETQAIELHFNRPFIYAITEVSTGAILFIGQFTGVSATE